MIDDPKSNHEPHQYSLANSTDDDTATFSRNLLWKMRRDQ